ncbi:MAG: GNAT family N-acetyltransferase [Bacteroidales bacterium]|nr:GNAT family N-acetyltransferase [Bacteroidales bacterium]
MQQITSIEQIQNASAEIRAKHLGFLTNFYLDEEKHRIWIAKGDCFVENVGNTLFIIKKSPSFWNVFYCSTTLEQLSGDLLQFKKAHDGQTLVFDIVGREVQCQPMVEMFRQNGFTEATSLVRMTRMTETMAYTPDNSIRKAGKSEVAEIHALLHQYFDEKTEQIPYLEELEQYADQGHILICEESAKTAGFLIFEMNASTLYLRYWFTHPDFRDNKVGSRLLRRFFEEGKNTKRQLFWVIRTNENAIKRYRHYGFTEENMYDFVMQCPAR